jgi:hypothetical protein
MKAMAITYRAYRKPKGTMVNETISTRILVRGLFAVLSFLTLLGIVPRVNGCECPETSAPPPCALFWRSNLVFTALVTEIDHAPDKSGVYPEGTLVRLSVLEVFKGAVGAEVLDVQGHEIDCRRVYERGQRYLIYADGYDKPANMICTMRCYGRTEFSHANQDLEYIRQLRDHLTQSAIAGKVLESKYKPLRHSKIIVEGMGKTYEGSTDEQGRYNIVVDQPGRYRTTVVGPFAAAFLSYGANSDAPKTDTGIQYELEFVKGQCDYREVTVFY